jgi:hypothetical protein
MTNPAHATPGSGKLELVHNPYQQQFLAALAARLKNGHRAYNRLGLFAGRRSGKTLIGGVGVVTESGKYPNQSWMVCAGSYPKLHDFVMPAIALALPTTWLAKPFSASHYEWTLKNGTTIRARSLDDINRGRGSGLDGLWIDEARDVARIAWKTLVPALIDRKGTAIITTTPSGFDWCYEDFWKPAAELVPGYWACKYKSVENPALDPAEIESARREMDPLFFQQEMEAEFVSFTGAIYGDAIAPQLLQAESELRRFIPEWPRVNPERPVLMGMDPGADHPFGGVMIVGTEFGLVVVGEYHARNAAAMEHARQLFSLLHARGVSGANLWAIDRSQKQMAIELTQHGIFATAAENDVVAGINRVKSWLLGRRLWFYQPNCPKLVQQMFSYRWAENTDSHGESRRERVVKTNDDLCDALRYAMMTWPELPYPEPPSGLRDLSKVSDEIRWSLEREQRHNHPEAFEEEEVEEAGLLASDDNDPVGNFWG